MLRKFILSKILVVSMLLNIATVAVFATPEQEVFEDKAVATIAAKVDINDLKAKSSVLMDAGTGQILHEKNCDEKLAIASVTKVMSMLLIMEAIDTNKIGYDNMVTASEYASSMGGSQAYIEPGEQYSVKEALKAIALHSSNDVTVSMAELVAGSEEAFVVLMNEKAKALGMENTNFMDCTGLTDNGHYSSAKDIALMSRELITNHPKILEFTSIWMDTFRGGQFELVNTNKLVRFYSGADGLKTGFTNAAGHCLSGTAKRNDMRLISVVLGEPDSNTRFAEIRKLLDYGFANFESNLVNQKGEVVSPIEVKKGMTSNINGVYNNEVKLLLARGDKGKVTREVRLKKSVEAPVKVGQKVGEVVYKVDDKEVAKVDLVSDTEVTKASFGNIFSRMFVKWFYLGR